MKIFYEKIAENFGDLGFLLRLARGDTGVFCFHYRASKGWHPEEERLHPINYFLKRKKR